MSKNLPFRPNVCLLVFNRDNKLFLGERHGFPGVWQLPQGGVEPGSSEEESALREASEELGVDTDKFSIIARLESTHRYDFRNPPKYAEGRWRGQSQTFWLIRFDGSDADINLERFDPEFSDFCWCTPAEVRERAEEVRLPGYLKPLEEFERYLQTCDKS